MAKRVFITNDRIGAGDAELGRILMRNFIYSLARADAAPVAIIMMNDGVRLACVESESLDDLQLLAGRGVAIKACGTCLDYLGLTDSLMVGEVGAMSGSVTALLGEDDIVTIA